MKKYLLLLFAILLLVGCQKTKNEPADPEDSKKLIQELERENVNILVSLLKEHPENRLNSNELADYIQLSVDNRNGAYGTIIGDPKSFKKFTVDVFANMTVTWKGSKLAGIGGQKPRIEIIARKKTQVQESRPKVIPDNGTRVGPNGDDLEFKVNSGNGLQNGYEEEYDIKITIKKKDSTYEYNIDPVIRYHP